VTSDIPFLRTTYDVAYQMIFIRLGGRLDVVKQISIFLPCDTKVLESTLRSYTRDSPFTM